LCKIVHNKYMGNKLNNKKGDNMSYTANQIEAIKHLNEYVEGGDFWEEAMKPEEATNYAWVTDMINILLENGWTQKTAEGTIGSLIEQGDSISKYEYMNKPWDLEYNPTKKPEWLYLVHWINLDKEVA